MADRKTINKYYPPDFDPSKIGRTKRDKNAPKTLPTVRLTTPFSMRCKTCGEYIAKNRKFNARKETTNESYLGVKIILFHIRCPRCSSEIKFKTDPKNEDYVIESGALKNYERTVDTLETEEVDQDGNVVVIENSKPKAEETMEERLDRLEREEEEEKLRQQKSDLSLENKQKRGPGDDNDALQALEAQMEATKAEMETHQELEELYLRSKRLDQKQHQQLQNQASDTKVTTSLDDVDAAIAKAAFKDKKRIVTRHNSDNSRASLFASTLRITKRTSKQKVRKV